jgi:hypothetical protein
VLATNLSAQEVSAGACGDLYHQRWRIEEAFKRLKHRLHLEAVSGLTQQALIVDVAAKVLADNIASLMCGAALHAHAPGNASGRCNRAYAAVCLQRALPRLLLRLDDVLGQIAKVLQQLAANTQRFASGRSRPRPQHPVKLTLPKRMALLLEQGHLFVLPPRRGDRTFPRVVKHRAAKYPRKKCQSGLN